jgi:hypothetical protein
MRRFTAAALAVICVLAAACGGNNASAPAASGALDGLLLSPEQINTAVGTTGMTVTASNTTMVDDTSRVSDKNCLAVHEGGEGAVYAGSGWTAVRDQVVRTADQVTDSVGQIVILFPDATSAAAFFAASPAQWQSCANRQYTSTNPDKRLTWTVGPVSNTNGMLSVRRTEAAANANGYNCQRALTVRNNIAVDVTTCSDAEGEFAVNIAHQIAAKVPT